MSDPHEPAAELIDPQLIGSLPCIVCGYDLRGISIRGMCPECGVAVRATILSRIDPQAEELRPMCCPRLTALGVVLWAAAGLATLLGAWTLRINDVLEHALNWTPPIGVGRLFILIAAGLSGLGLIGFIRPTRSTPPHKSLLVVLAIVAYVPAGYAFWQIHEIDSLWVTPYGFGTPITTERALWRLIIDVSMASAFLCMRPTARDLVRRSLAMRTGRVDRQTLLAMVAAVGVAATGDILRLIAGSLTGPLSGPIAGVGSLLVLLGSLFLTLGMGAAVIDAFRIRQAIFSPAPTLDQVLGGGSRDESV